MNRLLPLSLAVALALGSSSALALGLGGINVKSELNAPLRAEIPVYVSTPAEAESLRVELAAAAEFARVGLDIGDIAVPLQFEVGKNARGEPVILVQSSQAIREPTLTFLVEVNWSNGRFLREYSVLLEPPVTVPVSTPSAPSSAIAPAASVQPIAEPEPAAPTPISEPEALPEPPAAETAPVETPIAEAPAEAEPAPTAPEPEAAASEPQSSDTPAETPPAPEPTPEPEPMPVAAAPSASEYGPIASGETLWEIANTTRPGHVTPSQMMLALLRANPDAFYRDNVNALKRGAILRIPGESDLQAMAAAEAAAEIVSQNQAWIESTRPTTVADASVESSASLPASASSARPDSRLELLPPSSGQSTSDRPGAPGGTGDSAAVRAELARTKESLSSAQLESGELRSRVKELENINSTNQRLLTLKDSELKNLQDKLKAAEVAAAEKPATTTATVAAPVEQPVEPVAAAPTAGDPLASTAEPVAANPDATQPDAPQPDAAVATDATTADPLASAEPAAPDASAAPAEVTPIVDAEPVAVGEPAAPAPTPWYGALMNKYVLGGLGLLVLGAVGFAVARRRKPEAPAVQPGAISGQFGDTVGGDNEESSMLAALAQDPTDLNAHLNVLEFYYMRRNADKFEAAAEAMYAQLPDPNAPEWQGALLMGRDLCPTHPMFSDGDDHAGATSAFADPFASVPKFEGHAPKSQAPVQDDDFDFDLGTSVPASAQAPSSVPAAAADSFDFNLIDDSAKKPAAAAAPKQDLSFDFDLDTSAAPSKANEISFELPALDLGADLTPPSLESSSTQQVAAIKDDFLGDDAVATKIDLARAYLDMGDADGARSMLEEVVAEGSESQKAEAKKLLSEIR
ncbi:MAG TPA: FimV/HubP family polar landmark protein [Pseudomonadota bacterium]|jgi:pilus assembly protein FimV|nr:FimV/HubP family polar landmark protein [Pseudomonadota bacterium]